MPYQMKDGKWRGKRMINGVTKTRSFSSEREAIRWEALQDAKTWEEEKTLSTTRIISLLDFATAYLDSAKDRVGTHAMFGKERAFRYLFKVINPEAKPENVTPLIAMEALRQIARDRTANIANFVQQNVSVAWAWGKKYYGLPTLNPFSEVEKFPNDKHPRYVPPEEDFWKVYDVASTLNKTMLLLMLHTGARKSEVFRLQWEDVDLNGRKIRFGTRKTGHMGMEYSWVPMTVELRDALIEHKLKSTSSFVFLDHATGKPFMRRWQTMPNLCKKAGVKPFGFHAIRHLSATILAHAGLDIPSVQAVLRHKDPNTTARYIKNLGVVPDKINRVFENRRPNVISFSEHKKAIGT